MATSDILLHGARLGGDTGVEKAAEAKTLADDAKISADLALSEADQLILDLANKEPAFIAGTANDYFRGDKSWVDFATTVRAAVLTGLSTATSTAVAAADTILVAIGKLQAQISSNTTAIAGKADTTTVNSALALKADKGTTLSSYGIADAYTSTQTDARIQAVVGAAPAALDTLVEIAAQLANDESAVSALTATVSGKEPAITTGTTSQYFRGDKTWRSFATDVLDALLTGLSTATSSAIISTDSVVIAFGKLQAQLNTLTTSVSGKESTIAAGTATDYYKGNKTWSDLGIAVRAIVMTGLSTATNAAVVATDSVLDAIGKLQAQINGGIAYVDAAIATERSAVVNLLNKTLISPIIKNYTEYSYSANVSGAVTIDLNNGTLQELTLTANTTFTLPASVAGKSYTLIIGYNGAFIPSFTGGSTLKWSGQAAPPAKSTAGFFDIFVFTCDGTITFGRSGGSNF